MSLRHGVTFSEEQLIKRSIQEGIAWKEIAKGLAPNTDFDYVKKHLYEPMLRTHELRKKHGDAIAKAADKKWADVKPTLPKELTPEDLELCRIYIHAPAVKALEAKKKKEGEG